MPSGYDPTLTDPKDRARFLLGDVDVAYGKALMSDEEIQANLTLWGFREGVAQCADHLASRFAQMPDEYGEGGEGVQVKWSLRVERWEKLARDLRSGTIQTDAAPAATLTVALAATLEKPDQTGLLGVD